MLPFTNIDVEQLLTSNTMSKPLFSALVSNGGNTVYSALMIDGFFENDRVEALADCSLTLARPADDLYVRMIAANDQAASSGATMLRGAPDLSLSKAQIAYLYGTLDPVKRIPSFGPLLRASCSQTVAFDNFAVVIKPYGKFCQSMLEGTFNSVEHILISSRRMREAQVPDIADFLLTMAVNNNINGYREVIFVDIDGLDESHIYVPQEPISRCPTFNLIDYASRVLCNRDLALFNLWISIRSTEIYGMLRKAKVEMLVPSYSFADHLSTINSRTKQRAISPGLRTVSTWIAEAVNLRIAAANRVSVAYGYSPLLHEDTNNHNIPRSYVLDHLFMFLRIVRNDEIDAYPLNYVPPEVWRLYGADINVRPVGQSVGYGPRSSHISVMQNALYESLFWSLGLNAYYKNGNGVTTGLGERNLISAVPAAIWFRDEHEFSRGAIACNQSGIPLYPILTQHLYNQGKVEVHLNDYSVNLTEFLPQY